MKYGTTELRKLCCVYSVYHISLKITKISGYSNDFTLGRCSNLNYFMVTANFIVFKAIITLFF